MKMTREELVAAYNDNRRDFSGVDQSGVDLTEVGILPYNKVYLR